MGMLNSFAGSMQCAAEGGNAEVRKGASDEISGDARRLSKCREVSYWVRLWIMARAMIVLTLLGTLVCASSCGSIATSAGGEAPVALNDLDGRAHRPMEVGANGAAVLFFVLYDCPI